MIPLSRFIYIPIPECKICETVWRKLEASSEQRFFVFRVLFKGFLVFNGVVKMVVVYSSQWALEYFLSRFSHHFSILALENDVQKRVSFFFCPMHWYNFSVSFLNSFLWRLNSGVDL